MIQIDEQAKANIELNTICIIEQFNGDIKNTQEKLANLCAIFPPSSKIDIVLLLSEKEKMEMVPQCENDSIYYFTNKSTTIFNQVKEVRLKSLLSQKHDFLLTLPTENYKYVKKLLKLKNHVFSCGAENKCLTNFDLTFLLDETNTYEQLLKQIKNYLIQ